MSRRLMAVHPLAGYCDTTTFGPTWARACIMLSSTAPTPRNLRARAPGLQPTINGRGGRYHRLVARPLARHIFEEAGSATTYQGLHESEDRSLDRCGGEHLG